MGTSLARAMRSSEVAAQESLDASLDWPSLQRCGGTVWWRIPSHTWDLYSSGRVVPWPFETTWCISPTRTPVAVQNSSLEQLICLCANYGQRQRVENLLTHLRLDSLDIHPAARADALIYLRDKDALFAVLERSVEARAYVNCLSLSHVDPEMLEWAQEKCHLIEVREAARAAADLAFECIQRSMSNDEPATA